MKVFIATLCLVAAAAAMPEVKQGFVYNNTIQFGGMKKRKEITYNLSTIKAKKTTKIIINGRNFAKLKKNKD